MPLQLFALERYESGDDASLPLPELPLTGVSHLISIVGLPEDDVQLAMVEGLDAAAVAEAMTAAGWRVDRITPASWVCPPIGAATDLPHTDLEVLR